MPKPEVNAAAASDRIAELIKGPRSGPLSGAPTPASATAAGLGIAFAAPFVSGVVIWLITSLGGAPNTVVPAVAVVASVAEIAAILAVVRYGEKRLLGSVGIRPPTAEDLKLGLGVGIGLFVLSILVPSVAGIAPTGASVAIGSHVHVIYPDSAIPASLTSLLFGLLVVAVTAIARELAMRGFAASRLRTLSGSVLIGGAGALALDLAAHLPLWGMESALAFAPAEAMLVGLFLWKRRLMPCVVANFTAGAMVLILVAAAGGRAPGLRAPGSRMPRSAAAASPASNSQREQAIEKLRHALESNSSPADPFVQQAVGDARKGDYDKAEAEMGKAIAAEPGMPGLYAYRGDLYSAQNRHDQAIEDYTKAISILPGAAPLYLRRGNEYVAAGKDEAAHRDFAKAIELKPRDPDAYVDRSALYFREHRYDEAVADVTKAIGFAPNDTSLYQRRATIFQYMHRYERAIQDCDHMIEIDSSSAAGFTCRATQEAVKGDLKGAIADLGRVLKRAPNSQAALVSRADMEMQTTQWAAARQDLVKLSKANSVDPETSDWAAWELATSDHRELRDGKAAVALATHACEATRFNNVQYLVTLAAAYAESGDFADAAKWQKHAIAVARRTDPRMIPGMPEALKWYESGRAVHQSDMMGPLPRTRTVGKAIVGLILLVFVLIGLGTVIAWIVKLANRRRRSPQAAA